MNIISYEPVAREIRLDREREAARWALADQLPRQATSPAVTHHGFVAGLLAMLSTLMVVQRGS